MNMYYQLENRGVFHYFFQHHFHTKFKCTAHRNKQALITNKTRCDVMPRMPLGRQNLNCKHLFDCRSYISLKIT